MKRTYIALIGLLAAFAAGAQHTYDFWDENYTAQGLLGVVDFEDFRIEDTSGNGDPALIEFSTLPQVGGAWTTLPRGDRFQYGLECSFLLGFRFDKLNYLSLGGSGLRVSIETSLWMFDLAGGVYASLFIDADRKVRIYGGGGPLVLYVDYRSDREETGAGGGTYNNYESAWGVGAYARAGIEFRVHEKGMLGLGARSMWSDVDFSEVGGRSELTGVAGFFTYTAGF
ncbi:MAG: hypothetical protein HKP10_07055 [Kiritimatiellales bacterium]|nr:hypothetical protein [Kiritimatiellales bacterium]